MFKAIGAKIGACAADGRMDGVDFHVRILLLEEFLRMDAVAVLRRDGAAEIGDRHILPRFKLGVEVRQAAARERFDEFPLLDFFRIEAFRKFSRLYGGGAEGHGDDSCQCEE